MRLGALAAAALTALAVSAPPAAAGSGVALPGTGALGRAVAAQPPRGEPRAPRRDPYAPNARRAWIASLVVRTAVLRAPAGRRREAIGPETRSSFEQAGLLVLASRRRGGRTWLRVRLPDRPNTASGWIDADHALLSRTPWRVVVSRRARTLTVFHAARAVRRWRAVVGAPATPTPAGVFALSERQPQRPANGFLGPWALHLTAHSTVLEDFGGGKGRVAIHGRDAESLRDPLGSARSHGCIRIDDAAVSWLAARLPLGTPIVVR